MLSKCLLTKNLSSNFSATLVVKCRRPANQQNRSINVPFYYLFVPLNYVRRTQGLKACFKIYSAKSPRHHWNFCPSFSSVCYMQLLSKFTEAVVNVDCLAVALPAFSTRLGPTTCWLSESFAHQGGAFSSCALSLSSLSFCPAPLPGATRQRRLVKHIIQD